MIALYLFIGFLLFIFTGFIFCIHTLCKTFDKVDNEHNFRRKEKGYKKNNSFVEDLYHEEKYQNFLKHGKKKNK